MKDDELLAIYSHIRQLSAAMAAREAALEKSTAELHAAIAQVRQLPAVLGREAGQHIAAGVKQAVQEDFSRPVNEAMKGPIGKLNVAADEARTVFGAMRQDSRYYTATWFAIVCVVGFLIGAFGTYFFFTREVGKLRDQIETMQQQVAPAPAPVPAPAAPPPQTKKKHGARGE